MGMLTMAGCLRRLGSGQAKLAVCVLAAGVLAAGTLADAEPALAGSAALPAGCTLSGTTVTCSYTAQGETQFVVPQGVGSITATVVGAQGGSSFDFEAAGGLGAQGTGSFAVTSGQTLYLEVDVLGGSGGIASDGFEDGGGGGGESDVRTCPASGTCSSGSTLNSRLLVAGGGGGGGDSFSPGGHGGNAGTTGTAGNGQPGQNGALCNADGGTGATQSGPGTGGAGCDGGGSGSGGSTTGGAGGAGGDTSSTGINLLAAGGGGAGWFGGGGGGTGSGNDSSGGGGGGSSNAAPSVSGATFSQAASGQAASVTLSYTEPLQVTTSSLPAATGGQVYSATLAASGGATPYTWSVTAGSLPPGLSLDSSTGVISGTPTTAGTYDFTVQVTDSESPAVSATQALSITVIAPLGISTTSLPAATGGQAYTTTLAATGGVTPYTWSVTAGSLPPGLSLDNSTGVISGTPDVAGTYDFTVTVTDAESPAMTASKALSISVSGPVISAIRPDSGPVTGFTALEITGTGLSCPAGEAGCKVTVTFGGKQATVNPVRSTEILADSPSAAKTGTVTVIVTVGGVSSQATAATTFTYTSAIP